MRMKKLGNTGLVVSELCLGSGYQTRERAYNIIDAMRPIAQAHDASVARVALAWLLHQPHVTSVIIGAKTREQLVDNVAATELKLTAQELETLNKVSALPPEYPGWMLEFQGRDRRGAVS